MYQSKIMKQFNEYQELYARFLENNYPNGETFLSHDGKREEFNRKNSQIVVTATPVDILFIGDSITEAWETNMYFGKYGFIVNRGIGGERLAVLEKRFYADCLQLKPKLCVLASGINDTYPLYQIKAKGEEITQDKKDELLSDMESVYRRLVKAAHEYGVEIWLGSVLPLGTNDFRSELILEINERIQKVCKEENAEYVDYHSALVQTDGKTMLDVTFGDMLHPHVKGYNIMYRVLSKKLQNRRR